jgi:hypothetical protein
MIRFAWLLGMVLAAGSGPDAVPDPVADAAPGFVLPGDFAESTTVADLQARFGADAVRVEDAPPDEGGPRRRVVLFPDDPTRRAFVEFHDPDALAGVAAIVVRDRESVWRGKGGVHVGMSFADLRRANGRPFFFSGFDEAGRAWVRDQWSPALDDEETPPGELDVGGADRMYFGVDLGLNRPIADVPARDFPRDDNVSSDDPRWPRLGGIAEVTALVASTSLDDEWE